MHYKYMCTGDVINICVLSSRDVTKDVYLTRKRRAKPMVPVE